MNQYQRQENALNSATMVATRKQMFELLRGKRAMEKDIRRLTQTIEERDITIEERDITIARLKREETSTITFLRNREARLRGEA